MQVIYHRRIVTATMPEQYERSSHTKSSTEHIHGHYTSINLSNTNAWREFLEQPSSEAVDLIATGYGDLPEPLNETEFTYTKVLEEPLSINAHIAIQPQDLPEKHTFYWKQHIIEQFEKDLTNRTTLIHYSNIAHDSGAVYVEVGPGMTARVAMNSSVDLCEVTMTLENIAMLENNQAHPEGIKFAYDEVDPYELFRNSLIVWSTILDSVRFKLSNHLSRQKSSHTTFNLAPPELATEEAIYLPSQDFTPRNMNEGFDAIAGYEDIKEQLLEIAQIFRHPEVAEALELESTPGIILHGPPGTGKTKLLEGFARELDARLVRMPSSNIIDKWVGSSAKQLDEHFTALAESTEPIVLLMDEFESLGARDSRDAERKDVTNTLKQWITTISEKHHHIMIVAATNHIDQVDEALIRPGRLRPIEIPMPDELARTAIWQKMLGTIALTAMERYNATPDAITLPIHDVIDATKLAQQSEGMTGAHVVEVLNRIRRQRLRHYREGAGIAPITEAELSNHIVDLRKGQVN